MKITLSIPLLLAAAGPAGAFPFTVRQVSGGFSHATNWHANPCGAVCADFAGNGQHQWYLGGETIKAFPASITRTLPAISLASNPSATARSLGHALVDADRDGDMDIVRAVDWGSRIHSLIVYLNQGAGSYTVGYRRDWTENPGYDEGEHYIQLAAGDFD